MFLDTLYHQKLSCDYMFTCDRISKTCVGLFSVTDKAGQKQQKTQSSKERKRKSDTHNTASISEPTNSRKKTRSEDLNSNKVKSQPSSRSGDSDIAQVSDVETTPPVRVSPRTTPSKERTRLQRSRERDKDIANSVIEKVTNSEPSAESVSNSAKANSDNKSKFRSRQKKEEKIDSPSRRTDSPRNWTDSPRGSPRRRSLSRTPVQTEAESVIKLNSGSKKDKKVAEKSDKKVSNSAKSETSEPTKIDPEESAKPKVGNIQSSTKSPSSNSSSEKGKTKEDKLSKEKENSDIIDKKVQEIKSAFKQKEKALGSNKSGEVKEKKNQKPCSTKKETAVSKRKDKKSENESAQETTSNSKESVDAKKAGCTTEDIINESGDNMHFIKKKQSILAGGVSSGPPQNSVAPVANIDFSQSLTDQITRGDKLTSVNGDSKVSPVSQSLPTESYPKRDIDCLPSNRDSKLTNSANSGGLHHINSSSSLPEERSQSRSSDSRCSSAFSGDEGKRPASRLEDIRSVKNSPASSPLIVDKSEPVHIYRDPELMSKNPVRSNVPNMHNSHKSYPNVHHPIPTQASRPASVGMPSTPLTSGLDRSSRNPVLPSGAYPSPLQLGPSAIPGASLSNLLPHGLHQLDPQTLAIHQQIQAVQQQQMAALAQQYSSALSMSYPPRGTLSKVQLEQIWQQKYPSIPVPPPWMLSKHDDMGGSVRMLHEQEHLERERMERMERERDREQRDRKDRERRERERMEKERLDR